MNGSKADFNRATTVLKLIAHYPQSKLSTRKIDESKWLEVRPEIVLPTAARISSQARSLVDSS